MNGQIADPRTGCVHLDHDSLIIHTARVNVYEGNIITVEGPALDVVL